MLFVIIKKVKHLIYQVNIIELIYEIYNLFLRKNLKVTILQIKSCEYVFK